MKPLPHQLSTAAELVATTKRFGYSLLFGLPRSGKTLTTLLALESFKATTILILCPKSAIPGWNLFINDPELKPYLTKQYIVTNYESIGSWKKRTTSANGKPLSKPISEFHPKIDSDSYQLVVCDEAHRIGTVGKPKQRYKSLQIMLQDKPHINLTGTPFIESNALASYYQFCFPKYTPFTHKSFYDFFRDWGIKSTIFLYGKEVNQYKLAKPELLDYIAHFTVNMSQSDAGIDDSIQAVDKLHYIPMSAGTVQLLNKLHSDKVITVDNQLILADTVLKENLIAYQIEGGTLKIDEDYTILPNSEKIDYIRQVWGDSPDVAILCLFKSEETKLRSELPNCHIYSSLRHAEGVDLSHHKHLVVYSMSASGSKYTQLRERGVNVSNTEQAIVHFLLSKGQQSHINYERVTAKDEYNNHSYTHTKDN